MLKIDLHVHTADDPFDRIPHTTAELVARAAELGFGALAITLHDKQYDPEPMLPLARQHGVTLIPGIERTVQGRHLLLINFPAAATGQVRTFDDVSALKTQHPRGLVIAPHPFFPLWNCLRSWSDRYCDLFDAVEFNGCYSSAVNFNRRAVDWARARGKPLVGGSDTHRLMVFGATYTLVDARSPAADDVCEAIKAGRVELRSDPLPLLCLGEYLSRMILGGHHPQASARMTAHAVRSQGTRFE